MSIYARRRLLYLERFDENVDGIGQKAVEDTSVLPEDSPDLGQQVVEMLGRGRVGLPSIRRADWDRMPPSRIPDLAGVKSWRTFLRGARLVTIARTPGLEVEVGSYQNEGPDGFRLIAKRLAIAEPTVLTSAIREALESAR